MSLPIRIALAVLVFSVATVANWRVNVNFGIERGEPLYVLGIGIVIALTSAAWGLTRPKNPAPPQSN